VAVWYLVRHGESVANADDWLAGHVDAKMTSKGHRQAHKLSKELKNAPFERAVTSSLRRASETARMLMAGRKMPLEETEALWERNMGAWARKRRSRLKQTAEWRSQILSWGGKPPGGESQLDIARRSLTWLADTDTDVDTLLVAHGGVLRILLGLLEGKPPGAVGNRSVGNCECVRAQLDPGTWARLLATI